MYSPRGLHSPSRTPQWVHTCEYVPIHVRLRVHVCGCVLCVRMCPHTCVRVSVCTHEGSLCVMCT